MLLQSLIFKIWYRYINSLDKNAEVLFMNYGYHDPDENLELNDEDVKDRYSIQLYNRLVKNVEIKDKDIVEIGCGRGGGLAYISKTYSPDSAMGVDLDPSAVKFANSYYDIDGLEFMQGDAQELSIEDSSKDIVINVESSHRYQKMDKFLNEVERILKTGGYFLFTDFRRKHHVDDLLELFTKYRFKIIDKEIINSKVTAALESDTKRREYLVKKLTPGFLHKTALNFAGAVGTKTYYNIKNRYFVYYVFCFQKI